MSLIESDSRFPGAPIPFQRDQLLAARQREQHRKHLQGEVEHIDRRLAALREEVTRLCEIRAQIAAQPARASA